MRVALIGYGGIGREAIATLRERPEARHVTVTAVLDLPDVVAACHDSEVLLTDTLDDLLATQPTLVAECAGHEAVQQHAVDVLERGVDLAILSAGALADNDLLSAVEAAAKRGGSRVFIPAGALVGIDGLRAAMHAGVQAVRYRGRKPPQAWRGTPAEETIDLDSLQEATVFYRGNARQAALRFPKNSNVAAIVALAGRGFDDTAVELIADPGVDENEHEVEVEARSGRFVSRIAGRTLPASPKTSALAAYSLVRCIVDRDARLSFS